MSLSLTYSMAKEAPKPISQDEYEKRLQACYKEMLNNPDLRESDYQHFFEQNPCMIPGVHEGNPSHGPIFSAVVTQPVIEGGHLRKPDFMWLLCTSLELIPVFIEIERPDKKTFRESDDVQNAQFTQAMEQINEWETLLKDEKTKKAFFERYPIDERYREFAFQPRFILVMGSRDEYDDDCFLRAKRQNKQKDNLHIMSFDRLTPSLDAMGYGTISVSKDGEMTIKSIPPTFRFGPTIAKDISRWAGFDNAVDGNSQISDERKAFLKRRYPYWAAWAKNPDAGLVNTGDWE